MKDLVGIVKTASVLMIIVMIWLVTEKTNHLEERVQKLETQVEKQG